MTETEKKQTVPEPIPVDAKKLIDALGTIFGGVIQLLKATEPGMAQQLADMAINGVPKPAADTGTENLNAAGFLGSERYVTDAFGRHRIPLRKHQHLNRSSQKRKPLQRNRSLHRS